MVSVVSSLSSWYIGSDIPCDPPPECEGVSGQRPAIRWCQGVITRTVSIVTITFHLGDRGERHVPNNVTLRGDYYTNIPWPSQQHAQSREYWKLRGCIKILCSFTAPWLTSCKVSQICNMSADSRRLENIRSSSQKLSYKLYAKLIRWGFFWNLIW